MAARVVKFKTRKQIEAENREKLIKGLRRELRLTEQRRKELELALVEAGEPITRRYDRLVDRVAKAQMELNRVQKIMDDED